MFYIYSLYEESKKSEYVIMAIFASLGLSKKHPFRRMWRRRIQKGLYNLDAVSSDPKYLVYGRDRLGWSDFSGWSLLARYFSWKEMSTSANGSTFFNFTFKDHAENKVFEICTYYW
jgi:hypothetical protein